MTPEAQAARRIAESLRRRGHRPTVARNPTRALAVLVGAARRGDGFSSVVVFEAGLPVSPASFAALVRAEPRTQSARLVLAGAVPASAGSAPPAGYAARVGTAEEAVEAALALPGRGGAPKSSGRARLAPSAGPRAAQRRMRVLVGEEDEAERVALRAAAEAGGHEVVECADGEEALEALESGLVDVGLIGSRLGSLTGEDLAAIYRYTSLGEAHVPLLRVSEKGAARPASGFPFDGFVPHRADPAVLLDALRAAAAPSPPRRRARGRSAPAVPRSGLPGQARR